MRSTVRTIAATCVGMRVRRLSRVVTRIFDEELRPHSLEVAQLNLLVALGTAGAVSPHDLGIALDIEKSTLSRTLRTLEREGLVRLERAAGRLSASLTRAGERKLEEVRQSWETAQRRARVALGDELFVRLSSLPTH
jgi:DNA-binding MarR family transcriptional regulator